MLICRCEFERTTALTGGVGGAAEVGSFSTGSILTRRPTAVRRDAVGTHMFGGQRGCRRSRKGTCPITFSLRRPRLRHPEPHRSWQGEPSAPARLPFVASFRTWRIDSAQARTSAGASPKSGTCSRAPPCSADWWAMIPGRVKRAAVQALTGGMVPVSTARAKSSTKK